MPEQRVEAVERALSILGCFREGAAELPLAAIARETGLYKSTILRLLASLERYGYVTRTTTGTYRLGASVWRLGAVYRSAYDLGEHIRPELRRLVEATGESASFYVREGNARVCLYRQNSPKPVRHHIEEGSRLPLEGGASALVILAWDGNGKDQAEVRQQGYAVSMGVRDQDAAAVSVPVFDHAGQFRGALSVSGLITRLDQGALETALAALRAGAERLQTVLPG